MVWWDGDAIMVVSMMGWSKWSTNMVIGLVWDIRRWSEWSGMSGSSARCFASRDGRSNFQEIDSTGVERGIQSVADVVLSWLGCEDDFMGFVVLCRVGYIHLWSDLGEHSSRTEGCFFKNLMIRSECL